jgi:hypothetical protein
MDLTVDEAKFKVYGLLTIKLEELTDPLHNIRVIPSISMEKENTVNRTSNSKRC